MSRLFLGLLLVAGAAPATGQTDSLDYEGHWRAAVALVDRGQETPDSVKSPARDSLYLAALDHARKAIALHDDRPEGHFVLAMALGRVALTKSR